MKTVQFRIRLEPVQAATIKEIARNSALNETAVATMLLNAAVLAVKANGLPVPLPLTLEIRHDLQAGRALGKPAAPREGEDSAKPARRF